MTVSDPGYPGRLRELHDPPLAVFVAGARADTLGWPRPLGGGGGSPDAPRRTGCCSAARLAGAVAGAGGLVVSGLALRGRRGSPRGCAGRGRRHPSRARLRRRRALPAQQPAHLPARPRAGVGGVGVPAGNATGAVAVSGPQPADRRARRRHAGGRGACPKRRADHGRPCARPRPRRAGGAGRARLRQLGRHQRAAEGRRRPDRGRRRSLQLARTRSTVAAGRGRRSGAGRAARPAGLRTSCRPGCGSRRPSCPRAGLPVARVGARSAGSRCPAWRCRTSTAAGDRGRLRAMDDARWATFDCYGTLIDWNGGIGRCSASCSASSGPRLLVRYHQLEPEVRRTATARYREVLDLVTAGMAEEGSGTLADDQRDLMSGRCPTGRRFLRCRLRSQARSTRLEPGHPVQLRPRPDRQSLPRLGAGFDRVIVAEDVARTSRRSATGDASATDRAAPPATCTSAPASSTTSRRPASWACPASG